MSDASTENKVKKPIYKKWWFWLIIVIIIVAIGQMANKDDKPSITQNTDNKDSKAVEESIETKQAKPKIGDEIDFEDSKWVVLEAKNLGNEAKSNNQFQENAKSSGKFILVKFKVLNKTNKEERIMSHPKLIDSKEREFKNYDMQSSYIPKNAETLSMSALPSGIEKEFYAVYEVPSDATGLQFEARELAAFGDEQLVDLEL